MARKSFIQREAKMGTEISFDSPILKKRNKQSSIVKRQMGNLWKVTIPTAE